MIRARRLSFLRVAASSNLSVNTDRPKAMLLGSLRAFGAQAAGYLKRWASHTMRFLLVFVLALLQSLPAFSDPGAFPWKKGDSPPVIAGVSLGMSREKLEQVIGQPTQTQKLGEDGLALVFKPQGVMALWAPLDGVAILYVQTREAADIGGVRIGDSKAQVLSSWGMPSVIQGPTAIYRAGSWGAVVRLDETDHVVQLSIGVLTP